MDLIISGTQLCKKVNRFFKKVFQNPGQERKYII